MDARAVVEEISRRAWAFGVSVLLSPRENVATDDGMPCSGYFDAEGQPILAVAMGAPEDKWLGTLLHEYSHVTQWVENAPVWRADNKRDKLWDWINGKAVKDVRAICEAARENEADCERRTVRLIHELQAPVDLDRYARAANAYVHFYNVIIDKRRWYSAGHGPYEQPEVLALCNPRLDLDYSKTPAKLRAAMEACL